MALEYSKTEKLLTVHFKDGTTKSHCNVSETAYYALLFSENIEQHYRTRIEPVYLSLERIA